MERISVQPACSTRFVENAAGARHADEQGSVYLEQVSYLRSAEVILSLCSHP